MQNTGFVVQYTHNGVTGFQGPYTNYDKAAEVYEGLSGGGIECKICQLVSSPGNPRLR